MIAVKWRGMIVHLIDGTYELFRHFFGLMRFSGGTDRPYGAVVGVLNTLLSMFEEGATHLGVATDHVIESFRNQLWSGYKTGEGVDPALLAQFHPLEEALSAMGVAVWAMTELEADDALASAAELAARDAQVERYASGRRTRISHSACAGSASSRWIAAARRSGTLPACAPSSASIRS
jgi:5'-3' exonuclease